jgi:hypothetical protein
MPCKLMQLPDGTTAIVCGPRRKQTKCAYCNAPSTILCDFPIGKGKTCDRPTCREHAKTIGDDRDYCKDHARLI